MPLNRCQQLPAPYKRLIHDWNETDKWTCTNTILMTLKMTCAQGSGCQNISHQQQFFSELPSPRKSNYTCTNYFLGSMFSDHGKWSVTENFCDKISCSICTQTKENGNSMNSKWNTIYISLHVLSSNVLQNRETISKTLQN